MSKLKATLKLPFRIFLFSTVMVFFFIYVRWFQISPLEDISFDAYTSGALLFGYILLLLYGTLLFMNFKARFFISKIIYAIGTILFFLANWWHISVYMPDVIDTAKYDGEKYYLTFNYQFLDYQWTHYQFTKWSRPFSYETYSIGPLHRGQLKFIYDKKQREVSILGTFPDNELVFTDGKDSHFYESGSIQMENLRYYLSESCNKTAAQTYCDTYIFALYQCNIDNTMCHPVPIRFTTGIYEFLGVLESNEATQEINLYQWYSDEIKTPIFTYGEYSRCYVEGCEILLP
ncbi:MAG: hypothetical protein HY869_07860 [Chloroflexi bacterium]|nr:hypothetical protein [Chloroflexota bacterium]